MLYTTAELLFSVVSSVLSYKRSTFNPVKCAILSAY